MKGLRPGIPLFLAILASLFLAPSALSLFFANQALGSVDFDIAKGDERAVAIIGSEPEVHYSSVEGALRAATAKGGSQTVYVLPGISNDNSPILIEEDCTVSAGVTLSLPYGYGQDGSSFVTGFEGSEPSELYQSGGSDFGDSTLSKKKTNQKTLVVLGEGSRLTIEQGGSLLIGGQLGTTGGGQYVFGGTCGNYAELAMDGGSSIDCQGSIQVRGYIKPWDEQENDSCSITVGNEGGNEASISLPLVFYDFPGGTAGLMGTGTAPSSWNGSILSGAFPFEMYDMPNVTVPYRAYYGSKIACSYAFVMSDMVIGGNLNLLDDTASVITLEEGGSYLEFDYAPADVYETEDVLSGESSGEKNVERGLTLNDSKILNANTGTEPLDSGMARTSLRVFGRARTNEVTVSFSVFGINIPVSTEGGSIEITIAFIPLKKDYLPMAFPFSYKWNLEVTEGSRVSVQSRIKFLPGASLLIDEGGTLDIASGKEVAGIDLSKTNPAVEKISPYYPVKDEAGGDIVRPTIVNNGSILIQEGASLGATISTEREGSSLTFVGGATSENTKVEGFEIGFKSGDGQYGGQYFDAQSYIGGSAEEATLGSFAGQGSAFVSRAGGVGGYYYDLAPAFLSVEDNGLSGFEILAGGEPLSYEPGVPMEINSGTLIRVQYPQDSETIGSIELNGTALSLSKDDASGMLYAEFEAVGQSTLSIKPFEWIEIATGSATIAYSGEDADNDGQPFNLVWTIQDALGAEKDRGIATVQAKKTSVTLWDNSNPKNVQAGWKIVVTYTGDLLVDDTVSITSINGSAGGEYTFKGTDTGVEVEVDYQNVGGECIVEGTLVDMADGSSKKVEDLVVGDMVMAFDHETGKEVASPVLCIPSFERKDYEVVRLSFSDGTTIGIVYEHGLFDRTLNEYVYLTPENAESYIGHEFYSLGGESLVLEEAEVRQETVASYSPVTEVNLNIFHEGLLGMTGGIEGLFNIFELDGDMAYDPVRKAEDIAQYGLFTYEEWEGLISKKTFDSLPIPYLKVSMGKGLLDWQDVERMLRRFGSYLPQ